MKTYCEKAREIPVVNEVDVLVLGGGPAGVAATVAAARHNVSAMLVEQFNCVGGMATSGMMSHWAGGTDSPIVEEIADRTMQKQAGIFDSSQTQDKRCINHEMQKAALLEMLDEAGAITQLYTLACEPIMDNNRMRGIVTESKSGREAILAEMTIDCTGDGDIAARAGAEYTVGRESDHKCQPVTLMFRIGGVDYSRAVFPAGFESYIDIPRGEIQTLGKKSLPFPAGHVLLYSTWIPGEVCVNMTNATDIFGADARDLTKAEKICRFQMEKIVLFLREYVPGYERCYVVSAAQNVGVRETRHFRGLYEITAEDILEARVFDDWIATRNYFNFDIHNVTGPGLDRDGAQRDFQSKGKYTIPYRACVPEKIDNLLLAGRCISGSHKAHSNFRVMPICANIGHGVGVAAALAVRDEVSPRDVDVRKVQEILIQEGVEPGG